MIGAKLEISTPDSYVGDIVSNLQQRRGLSQGRAANSMEPLTYRPAPPEVVKSLMLE
jgi:translation elongation factor EF-G